MLNAVTDFYPGSYCVIFMESFCAATGAFSNMRSQTGKTTLLDHIA